MRSFRLLTLFLLFSFVFSAYAQEDTEPSHDLFVVTFPYDGDPSFEKSLNEAMSLLLLRLTGERLFLSSRVAQAYLNNPKAWLKTYDIIPRLEDGVSVGKDIVYTFSAVKLRQEFRQRFVPIWPVLARPKTWALGVLIQGDREIKLDSNTLQHRLDADFRRYPQKMRLPVELPSDAIKMLARDWMLPEDTAQSAWMVQAMLREFPQDYVLNFKILLKGAEGNYLSWRLYNAQGDRVLDGVQSGQVITVLTRQMFDHVIAYYVQKSQTWSSPEAGGEPAEIMLGIHNITQLEQVVFFENLLKEQPELVRSVVLVSMQAGRVQYRISTHMSYQTILDRIQHWPQTVLIEDDPANQAIELDIRSEFFLQLNKDQD